MSSYDNGPIEYVPATDSSCNHSCPQHDARPLLNRLVDGYMTLLLYIGKITNMILWGVAAVLPVKYVTWKLLEQFLEMIATHRYMSCEPANWLQACATAPSVPVHILTLGQVATTILSVSIVVALALSLAKHIGFVELFDGPRAFASFAAKIVYVAACGMCVVSLAMVFVTVNLFVG